MALQDAELRLGAVVTDQAVRAMTPALALVAEPARLILTAQPAATGQLTVTEAS